MTHNNDTGLGVTMMPKPFVDRTGNGCHLHITLHDEAEGGANIFADAAASDPLGLSDVAKTFLGGIIEHGPVTTPPQTTPNHFV